LVSQVVWIVEDSALAARLACEVLSSEFTCEVFPEAGAVLERLAAGDLPDVLLVDWELPDISGVDLCRAIRSTHDDLMLPILLVTGRREGVVEGLSAGANDFVPKPYVPEELFARVMTLARTRQLWRHSSVVETQLATTLRSIGDAVISTNADGRVVFLNAVAEQLTGWSHAEAVGQPVGAVFRDAPGNPTVLLRRDGTEIAIDESAAPIRDPAGVLSGVVLVFRDITDKQLADAERERMLVDARLRADFERQLIGIVSHDLRGPLGTIVLGTELVLASERLDEKNRRPLVRVKRAADQATRMVNDLLDLTKVRLGGGIPVVRSPGDLHAIVWEVIEDLHTTAPDRDVRLSSTGDGKGLWDSDRLSQVVHNLVGNALKYGPTSIINVGCEGTTDGVTVSVQNRGKPIDRADLDRIFEPMQRATSSLENNARSVGLGLFIVKHIVEAHGGWVSVASSEDTGTTFMFWVPKPQAG
jgi:sigma-B regulation protein RsbU (phosphoserine phosphatase)